MPVLELLVRLVVVGAVGVGVGVAKAEAVVRLPLL